ncbi:MAG: hypothetical protein ABR884_01010 [Minisyncoccia bacterium]
MISRDCVLRLVRWSKFLLVSAFLVGAVFVVQRGSLQAHTAKAAGSTITAASCNSADVQTAINSVAPGGTVVVPAGTCISIRTFEAWSQPATFGTADTTGERNTYFEDNTFTNILETAPDGR